MSLPPGTTRRALSRTCVQVRVDQVGPCVAGRPPWWAASRRIRVAFEWREWRRRPRCSGRRGAGSLRQVCAASPSRPVRWVTVAGLVTAMSAGAAAVTALLGRRPACRLRPIQSGLGDVSRRSFRYKQTFLNWLNLKSNSFVWLKLDAWSKDVIKNDDSHAPLRVQACRYRRARPGGR